MNDFTHRIFSNMNDVQVQILKELVKIRKNLESISGSLSEWVELEKTKLGLSSVYGQIDISRKDDADG